jgi:hypothetical protein
MTTKCEIDDDAEERVWDGICKIAAKRAGISPEGAMAILEDAGFHAYGHAGIVEAIEVVVAATEGWFEPLPWEDDELTIDR